MYEQHQIKEITIDFDLLNLFEIAKRSALIGNEILKNNYKKIQKISSTVSYTHLTLPTILRV